MESVVTSIPLRPLVIFCQGFGMRRSHIAKQIYIPSIWAHWTLNMGEGPPEMDVVGQRGRSHDYK